MNQHQQVEGDRPQMPEVLKGYRKLGSIGAIEYWATPTQRGKRRRMVLWQPSEGMAVRTVDFPNPIRHRDLRFIAAAQIGLLQQGLAKVGSHQSLT